jgi:hypothetical protein
MCARYGALPAKEPIAALEQALAAGDLAQAQIAALGLAVGESLFWREQVILLKAVALRGGGRGAIWVARRFPAGPKKSPALSR